MTTPNDATRKPATWDEDNLDIESPNMAALGGLVTDEDDGKEPGAEGGDEGVEPVGVSDETLEDEEADELKALERLAEVARQDKPDLEDMGMEEE